MFEIRTPFVKPVDRWLKIVVGTFFIVANVWLISELYITRQEVNRYRAEERELQERVNSRIPSELHGRIFSTSNLYK